MHFDCRCRREAFTVIASIVLSVISVSLLMDSERYSRCSMPSGGDDYYAANFSKVITVKELGSKLKTCHEGPPGQRVPFLDAILDGDARNLKILTGLLHELLCDYCNDEYEEEDVRRYLFRLALYFQNPSRSISAFSWSVVIQEIHQTSTWFPKEFIQSLNTFPDNGQQLPLKNLPHGHNAASTSAKNTTSHSTIATRYFKKSGDDVVEFSAASRDDVEHLFTNATAFETTLLDKKSRGTMELKREEHKMTMEAKSKDQENKREEHEMTMEELEMQLKIEQLRSPEMIVGSASASSFRNSTPTTSRTVSHTKKRRRSESIATKSSKKKKQHSVTLDVNGGPLHYKTIVELRGGEEFPDNSHIAAALSSCPRGGYLSVRRRLNVKALGCAGSYVSRIYRCSCSGDEFALQFRVVQVPRMDSNFEYHIQRPEKKVDYLYHVNDDGTQSSTRLEAKDRDA